jgi:hypothetical protein
MTAHITIGKFQFRNVHSFDTKSSWKSIVTTATIKFPNLKRKIDSERLENVLKVGDAVTIKAGYNEEYETEFEGYVKTISPKFPLEIECEDEMWKLKQKTVTMSWRSVTLEEVLRFLVPTAQLEVPAITLSPFRLDKVTVAQALQKLKDDYMLVIYFRGKKLFAGLAYTELNLGEVNFHFQKNVPASHLQGGLSFRKKEDVKLKVKAISLLPDNTKLEVETGDDEGNQTTLHFYNIKTKTELKKVADEQLSRMKFDGYSGTVTSFGRPFTKHGQAAHLFDDKYPEREGSYFIDSVHVTYGPSGYKRENELGKKASV